MKPSAEFLDASVGKSLAAEEGAAKSSKVTSELATGADDADVVAPGAHIVAAAVALADASLVPGMDGPEGLEAMARAKVRAVKLLLELVMLALVLVLVLVLMRLLMRLLIVPHSPAKGQEARGDHGERPHRPQEAGGGAGGPPGQTGGRADGQRGRQRRGII